jgi:hypothetical protein
MGGAGGFGLQQLQQLQMVQQLLQSGGLPPGFNLGALAQGLGVPQAGAPNGMGGPGGGGAPGSNMGGAPGQGFGQPGGGFGGMGGQAQMGGQGGGLAGLGAPGGGQGGGLSALSAANPQLAAFMQSQQSGGLPPQGVGQRQQGFDALSKPKSDSGHGSAPGSAAGGPTVEAEWAEPFAGKGKKEPPFPLKLHQVRTSMDVLFAQVGWVCA